MTLAVLKSRALVGMRALEVAVEVDLTNGLPAFTIVGSPETEVKEAKDCVRAALKNTHFDFPSRRITVNLAPADLPKESGRFDLPIALGILAASGQIPATELAQYEFAGELSLSGALRPIRGALAMTFAMSVESRHQLVQPRSFILPHANADEAALVQDVPILPAHCLIEVRAHFCFQEESKRLSAYRSSPSLISSQHVDFNEIKGQIQAKRALEIAAAGTHSLLLVGPPGVGKSMLATRLPGILPPMSDQEALESAAIQSLHQHFSHAKWKIRPYRAPHHTATAAALVGGGSPPRPGEISLAHHGVLFLDELPEFNRHVLEVLREPLESGHITISRAAHQADFPAQFQLIAAMNPCPCGYLGHAKCHCKPQQIERYRHKLSGPLLDRIDMHIQVVALPPEQLIGLAEEEASSVIAARVKQAHWLQSKRQGTTNNYLSSKQILEYCKLDSAGENILHSAITHLQWSARSYHRILKIARTIADLAHSKTIKADHVAEAIQYRRILQKI